MIETAELIHKLTGLPLGNCYAIADGQHTEYINHRGTGAGFTIDRYKLEKPSTLVHWHGEPGRAMTIAHSWDLEYEKYKMGETVLDPRD